MIPTATTILRLRFAATVALRLGAVALLLGGLWAHGQEFVNLLWYLLRPHDTSFRDPFGGGRTPPHVWDDLMVLTTHVLAAAVLLVAERPLVRWLIPANRRACPACGHPAERLVTPQCSECGLPLPLQWADCSGPDPRP